MIGLPNDKIEVNDDMVSINGKPCITNYIKEFNSDEFRNKDRTKYLIREYEEVLPNGYKHFFYKFNIIKSKPDDTVVPPDSYYLLGDNRGNADDSRYMGPIKRVDILGQVIF